MAEGKLSRILHLSVIVIASFHISMAQDEPIATTLMSVKPLWDAAIGNESQPCHFEERNSIGFLHGSANDICTIQINAPLGYYTGIEMPSNRSCFLYIERQGELGICPKKYVVFKGNPNACSAILLHEHLNLHLQGNASIIITGIPASGLESNPECPESNDNISRDGTGINQTQNCQQVTGYIDNIMCSSSWWSNDECYITFPSNCNATLDHREVTFQCNDDLHHIQTSLILYADGTSDLFLKKNNIERPTIPKS